MHILVLDSYHPSQPWSQAFHKGLTEAQQTSDRNILLYLEYLDYFRLSGGVNHADLYIYLNEKYNDVVLSGIIANDNSAADFVDQFGTALVGDAPKVTYTTHLNQAMAAVPSHFSLQEEVEKSVTETVRIALDQNPQARSILIIKGDNDPSRYAVSTLVRQLEDQTPLSVRILFDFSVEELNRIVAGLDRNTIVFCTIIASDNTRTRLCSARCNRDTRLVFHGADL